MRGGIGSGVRVIRLADRCFAVAVRDGCSTGNRSRRRIIGSAGLRHPVRAVGGPAGTIYAPVPCVVAVVDIAPVHHGAAVPVAIPVAITPYVAAIAHRYAYRN